MDREENKFLKVGTYLPKLPLCKLALVQQFYYKLKSAGLININLSLTLFRSGLYQAKLR